MLTDTIALKLMEYIVDKGLAAGTRLPSIRELASLWDCNASQVRTGLISLTALGIIDMHPRAGSFVRQLAPDDLDRLFVLFFRLGMFGRQTDTINLYAIKALLDRETFLNAVKYRTDTDLLELEENLARQALALEDGKAFVDADEGFHLRLARIIRNPLVVFLLEAVQGMLRPYRYENFGPEICKESYQGHLKIFRAIKTQDEVDAEKIAVLHTQPRLKRLLARRNTAVGRQETEASARSKT